MYVMVLNRDSLKGLSLEPCGLLKLFEMHRSDNSSARVFDLMGPTLSLSMVS